MRKLRAAGALTGLCVMTVGVQLAVGGAARRRPTRRRSSRPEHASHLRCPGRLGHTGGANRPGRHCDGQRGRGGSTRARS